MTTNNPKAPVAQRLEPAAHNGTVDGSNPSGGTNSPTSPTERTPEQRASDKLNAFVSAAIEPTNPREELARIIEAFGLEIADLTMKVGASEIAALDLVTNANQALAKATDAALGLLSRPPVKAASPEGEAVAVTHEAACAFADTSVDPIAEMLRDAYTANDDGDRAGVSLHLHVARLAYAYKALATTPKPPEVPAVVEGWKPDWAGLEAAFKWAFAKGAGSFLQDPLGEHEWKLYRASLAAAPNPESQGGAS